LIVFLLTIKILSSLTILTNADPLFMSSSLMNAFNQIDPSIYVTMYSPNIRIPY